jgi:hypothetical protein
MGGAPDSNKENDQNKDVTRPGVKTDPCVETETEVGTSPANADREEEAKGTECGVKVADCDSDSEM